MGVGGGLFCGRWTVNRSRFPDAADDHGLAVARPRSGLTSDHRPLSTPTQAFSGFPALFRHGNLLCSTAGSLQASPFNNGQSLSKNREISADRAVWVVIPDSAGGWIHGGESLGRCASGIPCGVRPIRMYRPGLLCGTQIPSASKSRPQLHG